MSDTVSAGKKTAQKNKELHDKDFYRNIGRKGGRISKRVPTSIKELRERITEDNKLFTVLQEYLPSEREIKRTIRKSLKDTYDE